MAGISCLGPLGGTTRAPCQREGCPRASLPPSQLHETCFRGRAPGPCCQRGLSPRAPLFVRSRFPLWPQQEQHNTTPSGAGSRRGACPGSRHWASRLLLSVKSHDNVSQFPPAGDPGRGVVKELWYLPAASLHGLQTSRLVMDRGAASKVPAITLQGASSSEPGTDLPGAPSSGRPSGCAGPVLRAACLRRGEELCLWDPNSAGAGEALGLAVRHSGPEPSGLPPPWWLATGLFLISTHGGTQTHLPHRCES